MIETTISEHIFNQGLAQGKVEGKQEGRMEGKLEGRMEGKQEGLEQQITLLKTLHEEGVLSKSRLKKLLLPLETQLQALKH
jgi:predicted transposase YdaD